MCKTWNEKFYNTFFVLHSYDSSCYSFLMRIPQKIKIPNSHMSVRDLCMREWELNDWMRYSYEQLTLWWWCCSFKMILSLTMLELIFREVKNFLFLVHRIAVAPREIKNAFSRMEIFRFIYINTFWSTWGIYKLQSQYDAFIIIIYIDIIICKFIFSYDFQHISF